jgi:hypothetical protein
MSFFQAISDFFESIFNKSSPAVQKKLQMKKLDNAIKLQQPVLCRNGTLLPNFAEVIHILYCNTKPLDNIFSETIAEDNIPRHNRFKAQLVLTGFTIEEQQEIEQLSYQNRKNEVLNSNTEETYIFEQQQRRLDKIIHSLDSETFKRMDNDLTQVHQLADFCRLNFTTILQIFDNNFTPVDSTYAPSYQEVPLSKFGNVIEDIYYQINGLQITNAVGNAVLSLAQLRNGGTLSEEQTENLTRNIKGIAYVLYHIFTPDHLKLLIRLYKNDANYIPKTVSYHESARQEFTVQLESQFKADGQRIKTEIKDEKISAELSNLFQDIQLSTLTGYTSEINEKLQTNSALSFMWIMPLQILKTFLQVYLTEPIKSLLNDIVIEGFFNNPTYKTDFSATVFTALECSRKLQEFENSFQHGKKNDITVLEGFMLDSRKDTGFYKKMEAQVDVINNNAKKLIQDQTTGLHSLYIELGELLNDAKKPTNEIVSNLKVLLLSSRNRDNTNLLERQYPNWQIFFEIMKNYAIISTKEKS